LYRGEISKSGNPILPSKRARKIPEKNQNILEEVKQETTSVQPDLPTENTEDVSIEDLKEKESLENDKVEE